MYKLTLFLQAIFYHMIYLSVLVVLVALDSAGDAVTSPVRRLLSVTTQQPQLSTQAQNDTADARVGRYQLLVHFSVFTLHL